MWNRSVVCHFALLALAATAGCAVTEDPADEDQTSSQASEITVKPAAAFVLTVTGIEPVQVSGQALCDGTCSYAFLGGASVTVTALSNRADCLQFASWTGACAGQGSPCTLVMNSDLSTSVRYGRIAGCKPQ